MKAMFSPFGFGPASKRARSIPRGSEDQAVVGKAGPEELVTDQLGRDVDQVRPLELVLAAPPFGSRHVPSSTGLGFAASQGLELDRR